MRTPNRLDEVQALALKALASGGELKSIARISWDISGKCSNPHLTHVHAVSDLKPELLRTLGEPYREFTDGPIVRRVEKRWVQDGGDRHCWVELETPCRKCEGCLRSRAALWRMRAVSELNTWQRSWFVTLTLSPENHFMALSAARKRVADGVGDFDTLPEDEQFRRRVDVIGAEITRYIKRVRKNSGALLRYMIVCEKHKSGLPHFHALIHEVTGTVTYATLQAAWRLGFSQMKLVPPGDARAASYVAKYLSKSALARVRASSEYGNPAVRYDPLGTIRRPGPAPLEHRVTPNEVNPCNPDPDAADGWKPHPVPF